MIDNENKTSIAVNEASASPDHDFGAKVEDYHKQVQAHTEKGSKKKKLIAVIFVLANVLAIGITILLEFNRKGEKALLSDVIVTWGQNYQYVIYAFLCIGAYLIFDGLKYAFMLKKITGKAQLPLSLKVATIGRYYDNITPLAIGGQPFQVYYLHKAKVPAGAATAMPIASFFFTQFSLVLLALVVFFFNGQVIADPAMLVTAYVGSFFCIFVPFLIMVFSILPKTAWKITNACLKLLHKIRIIKDLPATRKKVRSFVFNYSRSLQLIAKNRLTVPVIFLLSLMMTVALNAIPFFVLKACGQNPNFIDVVSMCLVVNCAVSFIPTPGNSGAAEGAFFIIFATLSGSFLAWGTVLWRVASYYSVLVIGATVLLTSSFLAKRRAKLSLENTSSEEIKNEENE